MSNCVERNENMKIRISESTINALQRTIEIEKVDSLQYDSVQLLEQHGLSILIFNRKLGNGDPILSTECYPAKG